MAYQEGSGDSQANRQAPVITRRQLMKNGLGFLVAAVASCTIDFTPDPPATPTVPPPKPTTAPKPTVAPTVLPRRVDLPSIDDLTGIDIDWAVNILFHDEPGEILRTSSTGNTTDKDRFFYLEARHALREALFYRHRFGPGRVEVPGPESIIVEDQRFNLQDPTDRAFARALVEAHLAIKSRDAATYLNFPPAKALREISSLKGKISFVETEAPLVIGAARLDVMARVIQTLEAHNKKYPKKWAAAPASPGYSFDKETVYFDRRKPVEGFGWYTYVTEGELAKKFSGAEKFAERCLDYLIDGQILRNRIAYWEATGQGEKASRAKVEYEDLRNFYGFEVLTAGVVGGEPVVEMGQVMLVQEYDAKPGFEGIFLRPRLTTERDPAWPIVSDGDHVKVLDIGGALKYDNWHSYYSEQVLRMVKVQAGGLREGGWVADPVRVGIMPLQYLRHLPKTNQ